MQGGNYVASLARAWIEWSSALGCAIHRLATEATGRKNNEITVRVLGRPRRCILSAPTWVSNVARFRRKRGWCVVGACGVRGVSKGLFTGYPCAFHAQACLHRKQPTNNEGTG